jgi:hypothetical protein
MDSSSAREKTLPLGLFGVLKTIARVRGDTACSRRSGSNVKSGPPSGTQTGTAPEMMHPGP